MVSWPIWAILNKGLSFEFKDFKQIFFKLYISIHPLINVVTVKNPNHGDKNVAFVLS
jgi:hypothetical protein